MPSQASLRCSRPFPVANVPYITPPSPVCQPLFRLFSQYILASQKKIRKRVYTSDHPLFFYLILRDAEVAVPCGIY